MQHQRTLVVATTSDYIDILRHKYPQKSLVFITSPAIRARAVEQSPPADEELLCELDSPKAVIGSLRNHILTYGMTLKGVACFDCESMELCAHIASAFNLSYPSVGTVRACRDKSVTRKIWHANGVQTPEYARIRSEQEAAEFFEDAGSPCVLKPVDSSGSERVFRCTTSLECKEAYDIICAPQQSPDAIIETCVDGIEYSCDFIINGTDIIPIRFTRKIHSPIPVFGTIMAYEVVKFPHGNFSESDLLRLLSKAAQALGITRGICMVDFIVKSNGVDNSVSYGECHYGDSESNNREIISSTICYCDGSTQQDSIYLLEMTPRPGGDCLPWLIQKSMNIDILKLNLDVAGQGNMGKGYAGEDSFFLNPYPVFKPLVGLRIHADREGILNLIDMQTVSSDPRVMEVFIKHKAGHKIVLPPRDYDSWNLGHIIFTPFENIPCKDQCINLLSMLRTEMVTLS
ncbi:MAG: ATP-grasp domain-containing protein [Desulfamplus sp.]|nr:ATP-grasp domain-containing protein [Desulfamplus sp.]